MIEWLIRTLRMMKAGTASISKLSAMSLCSSASTWAYVRPCTVNLDIEPSTCRKRPAGYFLASSATTSFICLHGSAQGAQKLITETRFRSADSRV